MGVVVLIKFTIVTPPPSPLPQGGGMLGYGGLAVRLFTIIA